MDKQLSEAGEPPVRREGLRSDIWVLMDFGCVIVHVFTDEARKFYNLERLWSDAEVVDPSSLGEPLTTGAFGLKIKIRSGELIHHEI